MANGFFFRGDIYLIKWINYMFIEATEFRLMKEGWTTPQSLVINDAFPL